MERLKELFYDFNNSKEYRELGETLEVKEASAAFYAFVKNHLSKDEFQDLEEIFVGNMLYNEMQGWTYGFRYAVQLMAECFPKKGGASNG